MHQAMNTHDSTISKVLTVLKWRMITTFNRKSLEKQRVKSRFAFYEVHNKHQYIAEVVALLIIHLY